MSEELHQALDLARQLFAMVNDRVKESTGQGALQNVFDMAQPAMQEVVPAAFVLLPIIRGVILPMVENALTPDEYDAVVGSIAIIEQGVSSIVAAAAIERQRIQAMSADELERYARENGLYRNEGTS
ncbi:hypothetical protein [uncultured Hyphomicrobium sp.]|uniref:hypothetical protein n=1 Tax=uncultured Hyphomicrobium sp. TaxID=194373 RepID=UPI0025E957F5|nr:hypothetical protein [uncultured Hyphomicrobium sp.]